MCGNCIERSGGTETAKLCSFIPLSATRHQNRGGGVLLKTVELASGKKLFYPLHIYCYVDIRTSLQMLLRQQEFTVSLDHWSSSDRQNILRDVYNGCMWKEFLYWNSKPFLIVFLQP